MRSSVKSSLAFLAITIFVHGTATRYSGSDGGNGFIPVGGRYGPTMYNGLHFFPGGSSYYNGGYIIGPIYGSMNPIYHQGSFLYGTGKGGNIVGPERFNLGYHHGSERSGPSPTYKRHGHGLSRDGNGNNVMLRRDGPWPQGR